MGERASRSEWTFETLLVHLTALVDGQRALTNQRFGDQDKAVQAALVSQEKAVAAALDAAQRAVIKAEIAQEKRNEASNEFRGQLSDQAATLMPRAEAEQRISALDEKFTQMFKSVEDKLAGLAKIGDLATGRSNGLTAAQGLLVAVVLVVTSIVATVVAIK
jgi:hypothetical protein